MREVEFLPTWYPNVRRSGLYFQIQMWASAAVVVAAVVYLGALRHRVSAAAASLGDVVDQLADTRGKVKELDQQRALQRELLSKQKLVVRLGMPVEVTRVVSEVAACMPAEMSLDELQVRTEERTLSVLEQAGRPKTSAPQPVTRSLLVRVKGVAPTEPQVTAFYARLADRRFLDKVRLERSAERLTAEHVMREFEVSFEVPLDYAAGH